MKKLFWSFIIVFTTYFSQAQQQETRELKDFTGVKISGSMQVVLVKGEKESILLESKSVPLDKIITKIDKKGNLKIHKQSKSVYQSIKYGEDINYGGRVKVKITYKTLERITQSGSGIIIADSKITGENFSITESGSGRILIKDIEVNNALIVLSGSGKIEIQKGNIKQATPKVSGSGSIRLENVNAENSINKVSGSGRIYVNTKQNFEGHVSGSGRIIYSGNPGKVITKVSGSGRIKANTK